MVRLRGSHVFPTPGTNELSKLILRVQGKGDSDARSLFFVNEKNKRMKKADALHLFTSDFTD